MWMPWPFIKASSLQTSTLLIRPTWGQNEGEKSFDNFAPECWIPFPLLSHSCGQQGVEKRVRGMQKVWSDSLPLLFSSFVDQASHHIPGIFLLSKEWDRTGSVVLKFRDSYDYMESLPPQKMKCAWMQAHTFFTHCQGFMDSRKPISGFSSTFLQMNPGWRPFISQMQIPGPPST